MSAKHLRSMRKPGEGLDVHGSICGMRSTPDNLVEHPSQVTCRLCMRKAKADGRKHALSTFKQLLVTHAREELEPFTPAPTSYTSSAHTLSPTDLRALNATMHARSEDRAAFSSPVAAAKALAGYLDEGASVTSSSSPSRFEGTPKGSRNGVESNVERQVDRVVGVRKALERAFAPGMAIGGLHLSQALCLEIFLWRHAGKPYLVGRPGKRAECVARRKVDLGWIVQEVERVAQLTLTPHQVSLVVKHGNNALDDYLERTKPQALAA